MTTHNTQPPTAVIQLIARAQIAQGPNPRTHFDQGRIEELRNSMRVRGFDSAFPLIVRERGQYYELACGERRWRAAGEEGIVELPCIIREMNDQEMLELALVENLQRESLSVMEEALGYQRLLELRDEKGKAVHTFESIGEKVGRSRIHVLHLISLCRLQGTKIAASLENGQLSKEHGLILARIPSQGLRNKLLKEIFHPRYGEDGSMPVAELRKRVKMEYMIELRGCQFETENAALVPIQENNGERIMGGACGDCPWNSKNADGEKNSQRHICMNPECFRAKTDAAFEAWRLTVTDLEKGRVTLPAGENNMLFDQYGVNLPYNSPYVDLNDAPDEDDLKSGVKNGKSFKSLIKGQGVQVIMAKDGNGKVRELADRNLVMEAAREADKEKPAEERIFKPQRDGKKHENDEQHESRVKALKAELEFKNRMNEASMRAVVDGAKVSKFPEEFWPLAMEGLIHCLDELGDGAEVAARQGWKEGDGESCDWLLRKAKKLEGPLRNALIVDLLLMLFLGEARMEALPKWAKVFKVDLKTVRKQVANEIAVEQKAKEEKAAPPDSGMSFSDHKLKVEEFEWNDSGICVNPDICTIQFPKSLKNIKAGVDLGRTKKGWKYGVNYQVGQEGGGCGAAMASVGYSTSILACHSGLLEILAKFRALNAPAAAIKILEACIAECESPAAKKIAKK